MRERDGGGGGGGGVHIKCIISLCRFSNWNLI